MKQQEVLRIERNLDLESTANESLTMCDESTQKWCHRQMTYTRLSNVTIHYRHQELFRRTIGSVCSQRSFEK